MNDLIKEYLQFNHINYSYSVFEQECGNNTDKLDREIIAQSLGVIENDNTKRVPLLYSLVFG